MTRTPAPNASTSEMARALLAELRHVIDIEDFPGGAQDIVYKMNFKQATDYLTAAIEAAERPLREQRDAMVERYEYLCAKSLEREEKHNADVAALREEIVRLRAFINNLPDILNATERELLSARREGFEEARELVKNFKPGPLQPDRGDWVYRHDLLRALQPKPEQQR